MTNEEAIKFLKQLYPYGGHCWLDGQRTEAIGMAIKALQQSVSVWHDASDEPDHESNCLIYYKVGDKASYQDVFPVLYNKKTKEFVSASYPHATVQKIEYGSFLDGHGLVDVCKNMRDRFPLADIDKWAYIDDIIKLSNVEKGWKEGVRGSYKTMTE